MTNINQTLKLLRAILIHPNVTMLGNFVKMHHLPLATNCVKFHSIT